MVLDVVSEAGRGVELKETPSADGVADVLHAVRDLSVLAVAVGSQCVLGGQGLTAGAACQLSRDADDSPCWLTGAVPKGLNGAEECTVATEPLAMLEEPGRVSADGGAEPAGQEARIQACGYPYRLDRGNDIGRPTDISQPSCLENLPD